MRTRLMSLAVTGTILAGGIVVGVGSAAATSSEPAVVSAINLSRSADGGITVAGPFVAGAQGATPTPSPTSSSSPASSPTASPTPTSAAPSTSTAPAPSPSPSPTTAPVREPSVSGPGSFVERPGVRTYALSGMQVGVGGDPQVNGDRLRAVLAAARPGDVVTVAPGLYRLAGAVDFTVPDVTLKGLGAAREDVVFEHTTELKASFRVKAGGVHFYNFTHRVHATARSSLAQMGEGNIWVEGGHKGFRMQDVLAWGSRDAAIFLAGVHEFAFNRVESRDSMSDCFHVAYGSSYGTWYDSKSTRCGDDGIGFVGYDAEGPGTPHHHTVVRHHVAGQSWGRGIGMVHTNNITLHGPTLIEDSAGAAVLIARENHVGSGGTRSIRVLGELRLRRSNSHTGIGHGAIIIHNPEGSAAISDVQISGPVLIADTRTTAPGQVRVFGSGPITASIADVSFWGTGPTSRLWTSLAPGSSLTTPGWSASTPYSGTEPAFPRR